MDRDKSIISLVEYTFYRYYYDLSQVFNENKRFAEVYPEMLKILGTIIPYWKKIQKKS